MKRFNKLVIFTLIFILLSITAVLAEGSLEAAESTWVYDETNSLSEETVKYITDLNEGELSEHQYAVYITKTIDKDMDSYKLDLFNKLGVGSQELNSGVLFILATEDREYGIEIGDGFTGNQRHALEADLVRNVALSELKEGDWDGAVFKVSQEIERLIVNSDVNTIIDDEVNGFVEASRERMLEAIAATMVVMLILLLIAMAIGVLFSMINLPALRFKRSQEYDNFTNINSLDKKKLIKELNFERYEFDTSGLYEITVDRISGDLSSKTRMEISKDLVKKLFSLEHYTENKNKSISQHSNFVELAHNKYQEELRLEREQHQLLLDRNIEYTKDIMIELKAYDVKKYNMIIDLLMSKSSQATSKEELYYWVNNEVKNIEIKEQLNSMFSPSEAKDIFNNLRGTNEYNNFISGGSNSYNTDNNANKAPGVNPAFMWLWLYGTARNRKVEEDNRRYKENQRRAQERLTRERANSNGYSSFGGGFGGGSSSGGGSSGKF